MSIFRRAFMFKVTGSRSKVELGSDHDIAQLDHGRNMRAKFEHLATYGHRDLAWIKWQQPLDRLPGRRQTAVKI